MRLLCYNLLILQQVTLAAAIYLIRITDHPTKKLKRYLAYGVAPNKDEILMLTYVDHQERADIVKSLDTCPIGYLFFHLAMTFDVLDIDSLLRDAFSGRDVNDQLRYSLHDGTAVVYESPEKTLGGVIINMMAMETKDKELIQGTAGKNGFDPDINNTRSRRSFGGVDEDETYSFPTNTQAMEIIELK